MSDYESGRRAARDELAAQRQIEKFWGSLHKFYPQLKGHDALAKQTLHRNMAKYGDMSPEECVNALGRDVTKEIERRARRDADPGYKEALIMRGGPDQDDDASPALNEEIYDHDPRETGLGAAIRNRRARRLNAQRGFLDSDSSDRRRAALRDD